MDETDFGTDAGFAAARHQLADITAQARQNQERARALAADVDTIVEQARSSRGEVTVRSRVGGRVEGIEFAPGAENIDLTTLARLTVETIAAAQHKAMSRLADRGGELFGDESDIATNLRRDAASGYPSPTLEG